MSDKMRAEFEAWRLRNFCGGAERLKKCSNAPEIYYYADEQEAWKVWQASRAALAPAAKPRLTGANGGEFKFVLKWDGVDSHPYFEILNGVFDMAGKNHISDLLIAISDLISEYAESISTPPTRTGIIESAGVRAKP